MPKQNIFITGQAGTGKTYWINDFIRNHENVIVAASTGTAAIDIGGVTMHRLFSVPIPAYGANPMKVPESKLEVFRNCDTIIIDEISMCRNDVFAFSMKILHRAEKLFKRKIQVIVSGDFSQLPPVIKKSDLSYLKKYGFDPSGYAFTTKEWQDLNFKIMEMSDIKRQKDREYIEQLGSLRRGDASCISYFNQFVSDVYPENAVYICGTNREAAMLNNEYLDGIDGEVIAYRAKIEGTVGKELPCEDILLLKVGCRVMFTVNDVRSFDGIGQYQNGTCGTVKDVFLDSVLVELDTGERILVEENVWKVYDYKTSRETGELTRTERGSVRQLPLKVAKAITIHKSQGKTFECAVISPDIFASGQLYVALSRVQSPDGLILTRELDENAIIQNDLVEKFYSDGYTYKIPAATLKKLDSIDKKMNRPVRSKASKTKKTTGKTSKTTQKTKTGSESGGTKTSTAKKTVKKSTSRTAVRKTSRSSSAAGKEKTTVRKKPASKTGVKK